MFGKFVRGRPGSVTQGQFHDQTDAKWIVIRGSLRVILFLNIVRLIVGFIPSFELPQREIVPCHASLTRNPAWHRVLNRLFWEVTTMIRRSMLENITTN
jgi:hypothetical protein